MENILLKYKFSDFTITNFKRLLEYAKCSYKFVFFDVKNVAENNSIILRHDLEFSVEIALKMAQIEADLGIKTTYFVQLHSEFYNIFEKKNILQLNEIKKLGHQIGLHFDSHFWNISNEDELHEKLVFDKEILEKYLDTTIKAFSFHNNNEFTLSCRKETYGGLINVYSDYFRENYDYNADSLGYWRFERLEDLLMQRKYDKLQVLIHDGMWQDEILPPRQRVFKVIDENSKRLKELYDDFLVTVGQKNIDWEGDINEKN
jgi:hypothetical protein